MPCASPDRIARNACRAHFDLDSRALRGGLCVRNGAQCSIHPFIHVARIARSLFSVLRSLRLHFMVYRLFERDLSIDTVCGRLVFWYEREVHHEKQLGLVDGLPGDFALEYVSESVRVPGQSGFVRYAGNRKLSHDQGA